MINLNPLNLIIFKSLWDLGLTVVGLGVIMYLAFFGFADKENWTPDSYECASRTLRDELRIGQKLSLGEYQRL